MIKNYTITGAREVEQTKNHDTNTVSFFAQGDEYMKVSDGYHTMDELYEHRIALYITLCQFAKHKTAVWKSKKHSDGSVMEGWFILGINKIAGTQITYHIPLKYWDECRDIETLEVAPEFDGHTSAEVLRRLFIF